jgi:hypothetical protein
MINSFRKYFRRSNFNSKLIIKVGVLQLKNGSSISCTLSITNTGEYTAYVLLLISSTNMVVSESGGFTTI